MTLHSTQIFWGFDHFLYCVMFFLLGKHMPIPSEGFQIELFFFSSFEV